MRIWRGRRVPMSVARVSRSAVALPPGDPPTHTMQHAVRFAPDAEHGCASNALSLRAESWLRVLALSVGAGSSRTVSIDRHVRRAHGLGSRSRQSVGRLVLRTPRRGAPIIRRAQRLGTRDRTRSVWCTRARLLARADPRATGHAGLRECARVRAAQRDTARHDSPPRADMNSESFSAGAPNRRSGHVTDLRRPHGHGKAEPYARPARSSSHNRTETCQCRTCAPRPPSRLAPRRALVARSNTFDDRVARETPVMFVGRATPRGGTGNLRPRP